MEHTKRQWRCQVKFRMRKQYSGGWIYTRLVCELSFYSLITTWQAFNCSFQRAFCFLKSYHSIFYPTPLNYRFIPLPDLKELCLCSGLDVVRTDRMLQFYASQQNMSKLWDILAVYCWLDPDIGYCQGEHYSPLEYWLQKVCIWISKMNLYLSAKHPWIVYTPQTAPLNK